MILTFFIDMDNQSIDIDQVEQIVNQRIQAMLSRNGDARDSSNPAAL